MTVRNTDKANQIGLLISYYLTLSFWSAQTLALSMISRNIAGQTKKATVVATNFVAWAVGNAIGKFPSFYLPARISLTTIYRTSSLPQMERSQVPHRIHGPPRLLQYFGLRHHLPAVVSASSESEEG